MEHDIVTIFGPACYGSIKVILHCSLEEKMTYNWATRRWFVQCLLWFIANLAVSHEQMDVVCQAFHPEKIKMAYVNNVDKLIFKAIIPPCSKYN